MKYKNVVQIKCEICGKICNGLIGLSSHIYQSKNHLDYNKYLTKYPIDKYVFEQLKLIFKESYIKDKQTGCWLWLGYLGKDGYGELYAFNKRILAHRFSYELFNGKFNKELLVCHSCDNPKCVNPNHLWLGTCKENTQDSMKKGRKNYLFGDSNPAKRKNVRKKISEELRGKPKPWMIGNKHNRNISGNNNPMKDPVIAKKCADSRKKNRSNNEI